MRRRSGLVLLALTALWGCDSERLGPGTRTSLSLQVGTAAGFTSSADAGVVHIEGPTPRTVNVQPGETRTIEGLQPGSYTVALEALLQGRLESYAETTVAVVAGQNRQANLTLHSFTPPSLTVPAEASPGVPFSIEFGSVSGAESYFVEWDDDPGFASSTSVETTALTAEVTLGDPGTHFVRVRARSRFGTDGIPTGAQEVTAIEPAGAATIAVGDSPSSTIDVGGQLPLPIQLDLSQTGGQELERIEVFLSFDAQVFGSESWTLTGADFGIVEGEAFLENGVRVVRAVFSRSDNFAASETLGVLTVDAASTADTQIEVAVVAAEEPGGASIGVETFDEVPHGVTIQQGSPDIQTVQPGDQAENLAGGVLYFRVPGPDATTASARAVLEPILIAGGAGEPQTRFGAPATSDPGPFESAAGPVRAGPPSPHVQLLEEAHSDALVGSGAERAAQSADQTLRIQITGGTGNADLYVRLGELPTPNEFDCRPFREGNEEGCDALAPLDGEWFVMIRPFGAHNAYTGLSLQTFVFDAVRITTPALPDGVVGTSYETILEAADGDGTYAWSVASGDPPPGLTLEESGTLSGTPTTAGDYTFTVQVESASRSAQAEFTVSIAATAVPMAYVFARRPETDFYVPSALDGVNLAGGEIQITRDGEGSYTVAFGGLGVGEAGTSFTAFVNTVSLARNPDLAEPGPACRMSLVNASAPVRVQVECEDPVSGEATDAPYRVMVIGNDVLTDQQAGFSLHHQTGTMSSYAPNASFSWNSNGAAQTVEPLGGGVFRHHTGLEVSAPFTVAISTIDFQDRAGSGMHSCNLGSGNPTRVDVVCVDGSGAAVDKRHTVLQLERGRDTAPWGFSFVADTLQTDFTATSAEGVSGLEQGTGRRRITFEGMNLDSTPAITVTPVAADWAYCSHFRVASQPLVVDVACQDAAGTFTDVPFTILVLR